MALPTPRRLPGGRPSLASSTINTASSPSLGISISTAMARKASLNALTGGRASPSMNGEGGDGADIEVGDLVDVPGSMHGVVKFVGSVAGKKGIFAGVELSKEFASKGKNDGDVDGVRYFTTNVPGSGIFLPLHRASKRASATLSSDTFPPTPTTPSFANYNVPQGDDKAKKHSPPVPKFSQSVGPGPRAASPQFKSNGGRPSLPRPESPYRKPSGLAATSTPGRSTLSGGSSMLSKSAIGAPRSYTASPGPSKMAKPRTPGPGRSPSRANSRLGDYERIDEDGDATPVGRPAPSRASDDEVKKLKQKLVERDKQLKEQATSLSEMEKSLTELQGLIPGGRSGGSSRGSGGSGGQQDDGDAAHLRAMLKEKNDKIAVLMAEFDSHRADFRSTIDTLELASTETERMYEKRVEDLTNEVNELRAQGEDVDSVAVQLRQLEELVQELEEGLEDARRGEAEARGEVEFLRGEVERGRSELRREREKAAAALKSAGASVENTAVRTPISSPTANSALRGSRDVEQRDDEIRGLKAIIHSLSSGPDLSTSPMSGSGRGRFRNSNISNNSGGSGSSGAPKLGAKAQDTEEVKQARAAVERLEREKGELQGLIERKSYREEELEREVDRLRIQSRDSVLSNGTARSASERTPTQQSKRSSGRDSKDTIVSWRGERQAHSGSPIVAGFGRTSGHVRPSSNLERLAETTSTASETEDSQLWCEICEANGHDILNCTNVLSGEPLPAPTNKSAAAERPTSSSSPKDPKSTTRSFSGLSPITASSTTLPALNTSTTNSADRPSPLTPSKRLPNPSSPASAITTNVATPASAISPPANAGAAAKYNPYDSGAAPGKGETTADMSKWCALCERDGHDATNCPFEDAF